jgi:zinc-binding alcohol dehydrogenase family protein
MALVEAGKIRPVIGGTYKLAQTAEAIACVAGGHVRGTLVISVSRPSTATVDASNAHIAQSAVLSGVGIGLGRALRAGRSRGAADLTRDSP